MRFMIILRASRAIIPYLLERCWGLNSDTARRLGSVLSQGVEFAFVLLATDVIQGVISEPIANLLTLAVTLLMAPVRDPPASAISKVTTTPSSTAPGSRRSSRSQTNVRLRGFLGRQASSSRAYADARRDLPPLGVRSESYTSLIV
jgi:Kef-type K+ transport system membrane component KefB